jgi:MoxR-like ATPase
MNIRLSPVPETPAALEPALAAALTRAQQQVNSVVLGKSPRVRLAFACFLAGGHLLIEDLPGVGKTTLAHALAATLDLSFQRIQFTSDLLPSDIIGVSVYERERSEFKFHPGPLFAQLVLADEINRATPKTQSALLEAMAEQQVTVDGESRALPAPFFVVATQNPLDLAGTYPLPDAQLDRFLVRLTLGHPSAEVEAELVTTRGLGEPVSSLQAVLDAEQVRSLQARAASIHVAPEVAQYLVALARATREHPGLERGASTRAVLSLTSAARARALWDARDFVIPQDVADLFVPTLAHRVVPRGATQGLAAREEASALLETVLGTVPPPR